MAHDQDETSLGQWLASRHEACPVRGYDLHGLKRAECPECAARLHLQVGSDNLAIGPWALAVVSLTLAIGFDGVVAILITVGLTFSPPPGRGEFLRVLEVLAVFLVVSTACGFGVAWLVRKRRTVWNRIARARQWRIAWALFVIVGAGHAFVGVFVLYMLA